MYMGFLLSLADEIPVTFADKISYGTQMLILGMLMIFAVLGIIFLSLQAFHFICNAIMNKKNTKVKEVEAPAPVVSVQTNDDEIVAVIAAAIAAAETELPDARFRVVSFKRVS